MLVRMVDRVGQHVELVDRRMEAAMDSEYRKVFADPLPPRELTIPKIEFSAFDQYAGLVRRHVGEMVKWLELPTVPFKREMSHAQWSAWLESIQQQFGRTLYDRVEQNRFRTNKLAGLSTTVENMEVILANDPSAEGQELARFLADAWGDGKAFRAEIEVYKELSLKGRVEKLRWFEDKVLRFLDAVAQEAERRNAALAA